MNVVIYIKKTFYFILFLIKSLKVLNKYERKFFVFTSLSLFQYPKLTFLLKLKSAYKLRNLNIAITLFYQSSAF